MEALIRWHHPRHGLMMPDTFIPLAEDTGMIVALGEWVIDRALCQLASWRSKGFTRLQLAINLSPKELERGDLPERSCGVSTPTPFLRRRSTSRLPRPC
jgi:EAL domain-containing protein (putative c-di-GMP-specific phosphodiesterase class I)